MLQLSQRHISAGGNRHPAAADWKHDLFVFGSGKNVAIWRPEQSTAIDTLLRGHGDDVSAVRIFARNGKSPVIVSGSADGTVRLWTEANGSFKEAFQSQHNGAVNAIAVLPESDLFVTGAADATLKVWRLQDAPLDQCVGSLLRQLLKALLIGAAGEHDSNSPTDDSYQTPISTSCFGGHSFE